MAQMSTVPVFKCRSCGGAVYATHVESYGNDADASRLKIIMSGLAEIAVCPACRRRANALAQRGQEMPLNNHLVILSVIDNSGIDWYRKKG